MTSLSVVRAYARESSAARLRRSRRRAPESGARSTCLWAVLPRKGFADAVAAGNAPGAGPVERRDERIQLRVTAEGSRGRRHPVHSLLAPVVRDVAVGAVEECGWMVCQVEVERRVAADALDPFADPRQ